MTAGRRLPATVLKMRTMKAVAKSGVSKLRKGTEASAGDHQAAERDIASICLPKRPRLGGRKMPHRHHLEIFAAEQIAVAGVKRDEVDAGDQQQEQRDEVDREHHQEKFQADADGLMDRQLLAFRLMRVCLALDLLGDIVEIKSQP